MKIRLILFTLVCSLITLPALQAQEGQAKKGKAPETELGRHMASMNDALRTLRAQIADASKNADSLSQAATIRQHATAGMKLEPARKAEIPADAQAKFVAGFREGIKTLIGQVEKLEAALKANDNVAAAKLLDDLGATQKANHKEYKQQKKKKDA